MGKMSFVYVLVLEIGCVLGVWVLCIDVMCKKLLGVVEIECVFVSVYMKEVLDWIY